MAKKTVRSKEVPSAAPPQPGGDTTAARQPAHSIRYGRLKAAIWKNDGQTGAFYNVTLSRSYQDDQNTWHDTTSFNASDLPILAKLANDCHSWINWQDRKTKERSRTSMS